jgi:CTD small phosphatase-like protein 2
VKLNVEVKKGTFVEITIFIRPYIKECLKKLKEHYEIVLFTAAYKGYADAIINYIDTENEFFDYRLYRNHCVQFYNNAFLVKDLRIIRNRDLKDMVLVDNSAISFLS